MGPRKRARPMRGRWRKRMRLNGLAIFSIAVNVREDRERSAPPVMAGSNAEGCPWNYMLHLSGGDPAITGLAGPERAPCSN